MRIIVAINSKNNAAPPVTEKTLSTQQALISRAKTELYSQGPDVNNYDIEMALNNLILPGQIIEVQDVEQGETWRGKNKSTSIYISDKSITLSTSIERPLA